ncbi:uncharacterized protein LOC134678145 [Cydia fagiglandana]|uniref:uncharacterized protein LOC134678145 n=1 Tax=Cydia fagiglandana TaxID=1458189 RepID=UPI002FEE23DC
MTASGLHNINIDDLDKIQLDNYISNITKTISKTCHSTFRKPTPFIRIPWWTPELTILKKKVIYLHHRLQDLKRGNKDLTSIVVELTEARNEYADKMRETSTSAFRDFCNKQGKDDVCEHQYGFKEQRSTTDALSKAINCIREAKENKKLVLAISLDIEGAFDHAWWPALLNGLKKAKCPKNIYQLVNSYLTERVVILNYADATVTKVQSRGCVQGSVLGPIFWNTIIDSLLDQKLPQGNYIQAYADDVLLICTGDNVEQLQHNTNRILQQVHHWGVSNKLKFGPQKTKMITPTPKAKAARIYMNGVTIKPDSDFKLLGVIIDENLKFIKHSEYIVKKAQTIYKKLCIYIRPTWGIHAGNVNTIYRQVIEPIITYAAEIWHTATSYKKVSNKLLSLQRGFALKIIHGFRTLPTVESIALAGLTPLHLKVKEVASTELVKRCQISEYLPDDIRYDRRVPVTELLHPAKRINIEVSEVVNQEQLEPFYDDVDMHRVFTDGSKYNSMVGAAVIIDYPDGRSYMQKLKLHSSCTVFQAECYALERACHECHVRELPKVTVFSDSKAALMEISNRSSTNRIVNNIHKILHRIKESGKTVINFCWIKAHVGLNGNERADMAAKAAASSHKPPDYDLFPLSYHKLHNKKNIHTLHNKWYMESQTGMHVKNW